MFRKHYASFEEHSLGANVAATAGKRPRARFYGLEQGIIGMNLHAGERPSPGSVMSCRFPAFKSVRTQRTKRTLLLLLKAVFVDSQLDEPGLLAVLVPILAQTRDKGAGSSTDRIRPTSGQSSG